MRKHLPRPRPSTCSGQENDRDHHSTTRTTPWHYRAAAPGRRCAGWCSTAPCRRWRRWAGSGTSSGHTAKRAPHKGQKLLDRVWSPTRMALLAVLSASVGPVDGTRNQIARWGDYYLGRARRPEGFTRQAPAHCDGAAAQRGGRGAIARRSRRPCHAAGPILVGPLRRHPSIMRTSVRYWDIDREPVEYPPDKGAASSRACTSSTTAISRSRSR